MLRLKLMIGKQALIKWLLSLVEKVVPIKEQGEQEESPMESALESTIRMAIKPCPNDYLLKS